MKKIILLACLMPFSAFCGGPAVGGSDWSDFENDVAVKLSSLLSYIKTPFQYGFDSSKFQVYDDTIYQVLKDNIPNCYQVLQDCKKLLEDNIPNSYQILQYIKKWLETDYKSYFNSIDIYLDAILSNTANSSYYTQMAREAADKIYDLIKNIKENGLKLDSTQLEDIKNNTYKVEITNPQSLDAIEDALSQINVTIGDINSSVQSMKEGDEQTGGTGGGNDGCKFDDANITAYLFDIWQQLSDYIYPMNCSIFDRMDTFYNAFDYNYRGYWQNYQYYKWTSNTNEEAKLVGRTVSSAGNWFEMVLAELDDISYQEANNGYALYRLVNQLTGEEVENEPNKEDEKSQIDQEYNGDDGWKSHTSSLTDDLDNRKEDLKLDKNEDLNKIISSLPGESKPHDLSFAFSTWTIGNVNTAFSVEVPESFRDFIECMRACCRVLWWFLTCVIWVWLVRTFLRVVNSGFITTMFSLK